MTAGQRTRRRGDDIYRSTQVSRTSWTAETGKPTVYSRQGEVTRFPQQVGHMESMTDVVSPNYRKLRAVGGIINSPMLRQVFDITTTESDSMGSKAPVYTDGTGGYRYDRIEGDIIAMFASGVLKPSDDDVLLQHLTSLASTAAYAGVEEPAVQGQVFLAELSKTMRMIARPASGLRDYILNSKKWRRTRNVQSNGRQGSLYVRDVQRGTRDSLTEGASAAASSWNEARFGWRPFLMEMEAILDLLRKSEFAPRKTSRASQTRATTRTEVVKQAGGVIGALATNYRADVNRTILSTYEVRCGILYDANSDLLGQAGFRWSDLPASAYELIPFSFVVDWFLNLGDYIQALVPKPATRHLATFTRVYIKHEVTETLQNVTNITPYWGVDITPRGLRRASFETWHRVPNVNRPSLTWETDLSVALRSGRGFDALALLTQLVVNKYDKQRKSR